MMKIEHFFCNQQNINQTLIPSHTRNTRSEINRTIMGHKPLINGELDNYDMFLAYIMVSLFSTLFNSTLKKVSEVSVVIV